MKKLLALVCAGVLLSAFTIVSMAPQKAQASVPNSTAAIEDILKSPVPKNMSPRRQQMQYSAICQTPVMWCVIGGVWIPGTPCFCAGPWGPSPGIVTG